MILKISQNSHENTCPRVSFLIKLQGSGLRPATLSKKRLWNRCFPANFAKFLRTSFSTEYLWWLLLIFLNVFTYTGELELACSNTSFFCKRFSFDMLDKSLIVPNVGIPHGNSWVFPGLNKNVIITYFQICSQKQRQSGILYSAAKI